MAEATNISETNKNFKEAVCIDAGRVFEKVLTEADENDGCDGLNACLGGLNRFQKFIGVKYE